MLPKLAVFLAHFNVPGDTIPTSLFMSEMRINGQHFVNKVDQIMKKHSGIGMKTFEFEYGGSCFDTSKLNDWLQITVTSGIEELEISLYPANKPEHYNFPCSLLFSRSGGCWN